MSAATTERVTSVRHWNDTLFSFTTTRPSSLRFRSGHFLMLGLMVDQRPVLRAYSIASPSFAEELEFFSIKVADGQLTSRLQHLREGDEVLVGRKPVGTLVLDDLRPGRNLYLLATGTGLAPFMSIVRDLEAYERFERVILVHGVRYVSELAYADELQSRLPQDEYLGPLVQRSLLYYPTCTREPFRVTGRIPELMRSGKLTQDLGLPALSPASDRFMVCGNPAALTDIRAELDGRGFKVSPGAGQAGDYVFERAFVER
ncbi:ferredoxin--NADP reductase [Ramlibacter tataouinensis]|uniref:ferredoxin--NADP reductase n=1 Tax=Ramlibacter tataouinensis TaxID=94132 RepID=UPI0022F3C0BB|nr:ferredoxin--NADP reductase [Ramlibacter tataouinensis]WBX99916.1 ferredoxin--NADP reductase [Ramlibacter tataouinensis]